MSREFKLSNSLCTVCSRAQQMWDAVIGMSRGTLRTTWIGSGRPICINTENLSARTWPDNSRPTSSVA
jgi:hypothetical protein